MRELVLVRHAKSDWPAGVGDLDRPLTDRGRRDCAVASEYFRGIENLTDFEVFISVARRTQETWAEISASLESQPRVTVVEDIYEASLGDLLHFLDSQTSRKLILVGHNPGLALLGTYLTGDKFLKFPTLSIWHLETLNSWEPNQAKTLSRFAPRADSTIADSD